MGGRDDLAGIDTSPARLWWWISAGLIAMGSVLLLLVDLLVDPPILWQPLRDPVLTAIDPAVLGLIGLLVAVTLVFVAFRSSLRWVRALAGAAAVVGLAIALAALLAGQDLLATALIAIGSAIAGSRLAIAPNN